MTELEQALIQAASAFEDCSLPFMLIGGLAVAAWGEPRSTLDVDLAVWADASQVPAAVDCLCARFRSRTANPLQFVESTRVLPLECASGIRLDIVFGVLPLQHEAIRRSVTKSIAGKNIPVASVEDLILMKLVSERRKDLDDARGLLRRFGPTLDRAYLLPKLEELAEALARPDILENFRNET